MSETKERSVRFVILDDPGLRRGCDPRRLACPRIRGGAKFGVLH